MRVNKSTNEPCTHFSSNKVEKTACTTDFFCHAIENADGVPFQLIFGPQIGEGYYLNMGSGITELLGIAPGDFTERMFYEMTEKVIPLSDDISVDPVEARKKFLSGELKSYRAEVLVKVNGGKKKWLRDASLPLTDEETGSVIGAFGILYDISEHKSSQITIMQAEKRAEELDRLKKSFLRNISHEIRTPLNAIVGFSTLLGEPGYGSEQKEQFMDMITRSTDHLLAIITDIVELSKIEAKMVMIRKDNVNINHIIRKVFDHFNVKAVEKGISLTFSTAFDDDNSYILTDGPRLSQVLMNLAGNAVKFTNEGSVSFGYEEKEGEIEFYITDTGIGIPQEHQPGIFTRFYQADSSTTREYEGSGLGLTISKAYVELLGGTIWFKSCQGEGSEFRFTVPMERGGE